MCLNGWQHIGIAASVVWAIGAPIYMEFVHARDGGLSIVGVG
jgi:hypothetical protein